MTDENTESPSFDNPMDALSTIGIKRVLHEDAKVTLHYFSALDGWELKRKYREYLTTDDTQMRMAFTTVVLSYASLPIGEQEVPLSSVPIVNEQLECWQNVEVVFHAVLNYNGISTDPAEIERLRWQVAGEELAKGFLASVNDLMGPAFAMAAKGNDNTESGERAA
jgi:hypothetical protein